MQSAGGCSRLVCSKNNFNLTEIGFSQDRGEVETMSNIIDNGIFNKFGLKPFCTTLVHDDTSFNFRLKYTKLIKVSFDTNCK